MWKKYCEFKMSYYGAVALLYQGLQAEEQQKMGERVAYYQAAVDMLTEATKLAKNLDQHEVSVVWRVQVVGAGQLANG